MHVLKDGFQALMAQNARPQSLTAWLIPLTTLQTMKYGLALNVKQDTIQMIPKALAVNVK